MSAKCILAWPDAFSIGHHALQESDMSKGMDQKKDQKKKPAKTMKEKKAEKRDKKASKPFGPE